jgi:hypothetical protein
MVALVLVVMLFTLIPIGSGGGQRERLETVIFDFDRAVRFSVNESILRNSITRLTIDMDKDPMEYSVEYGTSANIILPELEDESKMSIKDREQQIKVIKSLDAQFSRVDEFANETKKLPENVEVIGIASSYLNLIKADGKVSIYFYPTGERDNSLIFISTEEELASFDIPPFEDITHVDYYTYSQTDLVNIEDSQDNKMKDVFEKWLKD